MSVREQLTKSKMAGTAADWSVERGALLDWIITG